MKLPGLQRYLAQNLGNEFTRLEGFRGLTGPAGRRRAGLQRKMSLASASATAWPCKG